MLTPARDLRLRFLPQPLADRHGLLLQRHEPERRPTCEQESAPFFTNIGAANIGDGYN